MQHSYQVISYTGPTTDPFTGIRKLSLTVLSPISPTHVTGTLTVNDASGNSIETSCANVYRTTTQFNALNNDLSRGSVKVHYITTDPHGNGPKVVTDFWHSVP
jgi:hypothetical protein